MKRLATVLLLLSACSDPPPKPPGTCSAATTSATVTLHTELATQLLDRQPGDATYVSLRDGEDGCAWQAAQGDGMGTYSLPVTHDRYAVAIACGDPSFVPTFRVIERSVADTTDLHAVCAAKLASTAGAHQVSIRLEGNNAGIANYSYFLLDLPTQQFEIGGAGSTTVSWLADSGTYDLAAIGTQDQGPEQLFFGRAMDAHLDPVLTADVTSPDALAFGAPVTVTGAPADTQDASVTYVTRGGTLVPLVDTKTLPLQVPTWPATAGDPGDVYLGDTSWSSSDFARDWDVQSWQTDPASFTFATPPVFDAGATILVRAQDVWSFPPLPGATGYTLSCSFTDHVITFDVSASVLGGDGYTFARVPDDPALPFAWTISDGCPVWDGLAFGSPGGYATEAIVDEIGHVPGAPAQLAGTARWLSRVTMIGPFHG